MKSTRINRQTSNTKFVVNKKRFKIPLITLSLVIGIILSIFFNNFLINFNFYSDNILVNGKCLSYPIDKDNNFVGVLIPFNYNRVNQGVVSKYLGFVTHNKKSNADFEITCNLLLNDINNKSSVDDVIEISVYDELLPIFYENQVNLLNGNFKISDILTIEKVYGNE